MDERDRSVVEVTEYAEELIHEIDRLRTELDRVRSVESASPEGVRRSAIHIDETESGCRMRRLEDGRRRSHSLGSLRKAEQFKCLLARQVP